MRIPALTVAAALASSSCTSTNSNDGSFSGEPSTSGIGGIGGPALGVSAFVVPPPGAAARKRQIRPASSQTSRGISSSEQYLNSLSPIIGTSAATNGPLRMSTAAPPEKPPTDDDSLVPLPEMDKDGLYTIENAEQHK